MPTFVGMRWLVFVLLAASAACVPWARSVSYESYWWGLPREDLVAPDVGPVLGEPDEIFHVEGQYWTRYRCRWFVSNDDFAWDEVAEAEVPPAVLATPRGPYGAWGCTPGVHGW